MAHGAPVLPPLAIPVPVPGKVTMAPPTFLELWGFVLVAGITVWILVASSYFLVHFLQNQPQIPDLSAKTSDQAMQSIGNYRLVYEQWRDSLSSLFDMLITKTTLPLVTLLLGYLFGRRQA